MDITDILSKNRLSFSEIARRSGISRNTLYNLRQNPDGAKIGTLKAIAQSMGYRLVITIERAETDEKLS